MAMWFFMSPDARLAALRQSDGDKLRKYASRLLLARYAEARDAAVLEGLGRGDKPLRDDIVKALERDEGSLIRMLDYLPKIVALALADTDASVEARRALLLLRQKLPTGHDACPRCCGSSARAGNATGWTCTNCQLNYNPTGPRGPLSFGIGDLWGSNPPWHPKKIATLIEEVDTVDTTTRGQQEWRTRVSAEAESLAKGRQEVLKVCR